jgi:hypothetical protein
VPSLVKLPLDNDKGLSMACELSSLYLVGREQLVEEVIEVRLYPLHRKFRLRHWLLVKLHDLKVGRGWWLTSP